ncbi:C39 family peptidase [Kovacikia minuta CCNUW1]|uniref:C39 family peptidase n=1 Tax=Kovacikia minuta TaxID=2931930 RepID=UPI001CCD1061|nr:C39 family peptidase [Kovacikia minuta]UBF29168.1 C39 family peptidase [Kovacikia minuta CCNUW1]
MAIQLKVTQDTTFKQTTEDSAKLPPEYKVAIAAGRVFDIHSWKTVNPNYLRVALLSETLGDPPRNTWFVYIPHVQLVQPASVKVIQTTTLKQSTADSSQLPAADKVQIAAGRVINLQSWATAANNHLKLALLWDSLGTPPRNTWYVYRPHVQFINQQPKVVPPPPPAPEPGALPITKRLNVPYKSQLDNALNPTGACNVTTFAMVMTYFQIRGTTGVGQLEDELYQYMENNGLSRWDPDDLATMSRNYGLVNDFTKRGSLSDIRKAIAEGRPCIIHGYFTTFGHIIVVRGYDQYGFFVNDPYGEWTSSGYRNDLSGQNLHYSNALIQTKCSPEGEDFIWLHRLAKRTALRSVTQSLTTGLNNLFRADG